MFSTFFINRPIFATVLSILIVIAGLVSLRGLPVEQYPTITPPTVVVRASYPGANASTIADMVGTPIEQQVNGVEGMLYMSSTSSSTGSYQLTITFEVGTDLDMATVLVENRVNMALSTLPQEVTQIGVTTTKESTNVVMFLSLTSDSQLIRIQPDTHTVFAHAEQAHITYSFYPAQFVGDIQGRIIREKKSVVLRTIRGQ